MPNDIRSNAVTFRDSFLSETSPTRIDRDYGAVLRVILFYLWRGCSLSRTAGITGKTDPSAALISLSAYEAILGVVQLTRMGYHADAIVLGRALMERISIVGYLGENRTLIPRYFAGGFTPYKEALAWAKKKSLPNWMILYSIFSGVVHSRIVGPAGHINNRTHIGNAFREVRKGDTTNDPDMTEELLGLALYSLVALDPLALSLIQDNGSQPFPTDSDIIQKIGINDIKQFQDFLQDLIKRYEKRPN
ncbi:MAG: hypothetical protein MUO30_06250 [Anaerolineales bacterium]|nr:hypothetical protein [Anaerolineales bacterium]